LAVITGPPLTGGSPSRVGLSTISPLTAFSIVLTTTLPEPGKR
jgi:hypothetical protein